MAIKSAIQGLQPPLSTRAQAALADAIALQNESLRMDAIVFASFAPGGIQAIQRAMEQSSHEHAAVIRTAAAMLLGPRAEEL